MNAKLDTGRVFERIFEIYREQFTLLIPAALILFIPVAILNGLVQTGGGALAALATAAISLIASYWYQGMVVEAVRPHRCDGHGEGWGLLVARHGEVAAWVIGDLTGSLGVSPPRATPTPPGPTLLPPTLGPARK